MTVQEMLKVCHQYVHSTLNLITDEEMYDSKKISPISHNMLEAMVIIDMLLGELPEAILLKEMEYKQNG